MRPIVAALVGLGIFRLGLSVTAAFRITDGASVLGAVLGGLVAAGVMALLWPRLFRE